ncbi:GMC oxidoreductase [Synoicihabitans lomoniglobus]|uniref:GMC family oxidoreductase n=1 Tax=Synoicihabitans lomoniglobus TaxID=2909285 RepID=A0AAE9ZZR8_9BACT|nr:GMC family oxidoreductase [Opitutaceae bacterium LMO-M01]WED64468.1 GMC family oxidoreductase [Opitutaceae bacterium LMO-M01]
MTPSTKGKAAHTYDAIVVGSGISGGWAAKELTEKGLKTLVLERGRDVKHGEYPTAMMDSWEFEGRNRRTPEQEARQLKQARTGYTTSPTSAHWFVDDIDNPYSEDQPFDWMRGYHTGGRSLMWGRHSYRWSDLDFEANARDGHGVDWPIRYADVAPWYDYVEQWVGINGTREGLSQLPDGQFQPAMPLNVVEAHVQKRVAAHFSDRILTNGRIANLTEAKPGRAPCQYRNRCMRGCPFGAYFSSNSSTLPAAYATGNLTLRPFSIVHELIYDADSGRATGVRIVDAETHETFDYYAKVIFLCASAIASTSILLKSKSDRFSDGFGNDSGELGHNLMDHHFRVGGSGLIDGFNDRYYKGRRPGSFYIPRFRNVSAATKHSDFLRGYGFQGSGSRQNWSRGIAELERFGADFKADLIEPGPWRVGMTAFGEHLPQHANRLYLNEDLRDKWGQPTVTFDCGYGENEANMRQDMAVATVEILEAAGARDISTYDAPNSNPGLSIHEMGTARMGRDARTSVLNAHNQVHAAPNVYVTDGACMTSSSCVNPSLTYMALTARAVDHAVGELTKMNL